MESCSNQKSVIFEILQIATVCLDDSVAHSWHSLNQLHEIVTWNDMVLNTSMDHKGNHTTNYHPYALKAFRGHAMQYSSLKQKQFKSKNAY